MLFSWGDFHGYLPVSGGRNPANRRQQVQGALTNEATRRPCRGANASVPPAVRIGPRRLGLCVYLGAMGY